MAAMSGLSVASRSALAQLEFLEVLNNDWRSDEVKSLGSIYVYGLTPSQSSKLGHALQQFWVSKLSAREKNTIKYIRVRGTGRSSSRIPDIAPWDFAISIPWLEESRLLPENVTLLADWNTYGNPSRFDAAALDSLVINDNNDDERI